MIQKFYKALQPRKVFIQAGLTQRCCTFYPKEARRRVVLSKGIECLECTNGTDEYSIRTKFPKT